MRLWCFVAREAETAKSATHTVLENYPDWWVRHILRCDWVECSTLIVNYESIQT